MYTSSVLSWTIAPCGQAAWTSSRRRTASPGAPASRARMRNSVGVRSTDSAVARGIVRARIEPQAAGLDREVRTAPPDQRSQARDELGERERLRQVVVSACGEAGEPVGQLVACGEEDHRRADSLRAERLHDVTAVGVGQADVDDERVRVGIADLTQELAGRRGRGHVRTPLRAARG